MHWSEWLLLVLWFVSIGVSVLAMAAKPDTDPWLPAPKKRKEPPSDAE